MYKDFFAKRISELRMSKGVSAREMSLDIGQNSSYINRIENRKVFPSMQVFFYICEYLKITPEEFFRNENNDTLKVKEIENKLRNMSDRQLDIVCRIIDDMENIKKQ